MVTNISEKTINLTNAIRLIEKSKISTIGYTPSQETINLTDAIRLIEKSKISTIGYTPSQKNLLEDILTNLNPIHINIDDFVENNFSIKSLIRNYRIDSIFKDHYKRTDLFYFDVAKLNIKKDIIDFDLTDFISKMMHSMRINNYKLLVSSLIYNSGIIVGGSKIICSSDLCLSLEPNGINLLKNRYF